MDDRALAWILIGGACLFQRKFLKPYSEPQSGGLRLGPTGPSKRFRESQARALTTEAEYHVAI